MRMKRGRYGELLPYWGIVRRGRQLPRAPASESDLADRVFVMSQFIGHMEADKKESERVKEEWDDRQRTPFRLHLPEADGRGDT